MAFNMRKPPFDDIRVRQAMNLLFNRQRLIENLFYNEYLPQNSIFPGGPYENPNNPRNEYNPKRAIELLAAAGWSERDSQGRLLKNGQPFNVELLYGQQTFEPILTVLQEDLRRVGISLNLRFVTFATLIKLLDERQFELLQIGYSREQAVPYSGVDVFSRTWRTSPPLTTSRASRTTAPTRSSKRMWKLPRSAPGSIYFASSTASSHRNTRSCCSGTRRSTDSCTGTSSVTPIAI